MRQTFRTELPWTFTTASATRTTGIASRVLIRNRMHCSTFPPTYPESTPNVAPMHPAITVANRGSGSSGAENAVQTGFAP